MHITFSQTIRCLLLCATLAITGCGTDPVRRDLEALSRNVIEPLKECERQTYHLMQELHRLRGSSKGDPLAWSETCENRMLPAYRDVLARTKAFNASSPEVRALNTALTSLYETAVRELGNYVDALRRRDVGGVAAAEQALDGIDFENVGQRIVRLAQLHHVRL